MYATAEYDPNWLRWQQQQQQQQPLDPYGSTYGYAPSRNLNSYFSWAADKIVYFVSRSTVVIVVFLRQVSRRALTFDSMLVYDLGLLLLRRVSSFLYDMLRTC